MVFDNGDLTVEGNDFLGTGEDHRYVLVGVGNNDVDIEDVQDENEFDPVAEFDTSGEVLGGFDALVEDLDFW